MVVEKVEVVLHLMDGRKLNATLDSDLVSELEYGARIETKAEPFGFYNVGILESWEIKDELRLNN